ncbi:MAG: 2-hydroxyacyl-CoA dehydratase family protein [Deltaproteobacteria bacterium]|jgi:benzoyl-CoA reductase/2-hydroxyglutaryl-CoA dehydratase subunit BcrC/BadD/HgdB|nr:2-hydroxyacyl-CoA dehydratase family protein [Deltaproteobacteria bacterium]
MENAIMSLNLAEELVDNPDSIVTQHDYILYSKTTHSYSPACLKLLDLLDYYVPKIERAYVEEGKPALFCNTYNWEPLFVYALGYTPIGYTEMGRYSDREDMQVSEDHYQFPVETCSMVKCVVGQLHKRIGAFTIKRILTNSTGCEPFNLAWEIMRKQGYEVFAYETTYRGPTVTGERLEKLVKFMIEQLLDIAEWVTGERKVDEEALREEFRRKNRLMKKLKKLLELRVTHPFYVKSLATIMFLNVGLSNYFGRPKEYEEGIDLLIEELENEPVNPDDLKRVIPIIWGGGTGQEFGVYEAIDQAGGSLLGFRDAPFRLVNEDLPPLEAMARYVYGNARAGAGVYTREVLESEYNRLGARGMILYGYIGCSYSSVDREMFRRYFHEKGLPCLNLEGSFQVGAPHGQLLTRVKAFVEMLTSTH